MATGATVIIITNGAAFLFKVSSDGCDIVDNIPRALPPSVTPSVTPERLAEAILDGHSSISTWVHLTLREADLHQQPTVSHQLPVLDELFASINERVMAGARCGLYPAALACGYEDYCVVIDMDHQLTWGVVSQDGDPEFPLVTFDQLRK